MEAIKLVETRFQVTMPDELKAFYIEKYKNNFKLYNWTPFKFKILDPSQIVEEAMDLPREHEEVTLINKAYNTGGQETYYEKKKSIEFDLVVCTHTLNNLYSEDAEPARQIYTMVAFARECENDQFHVLAYAFNKEGENLGLFLSHFDGLFEHPIFIAHSINDLVKDNIILFEDQDHVAFFDSKKYLASSLQKYTTGFVLPLKFEEVNDDWDTGATEKDWFDAGHEINTLFKKLVEFYETSFNKICGGTIEFEGVDDWIFVKIEDGIDFTRVVYHIKEVDVYSFIEKLNRELNRIKPQRYGRPRDFGYYLINLENPDQKYIVCLDADIACDLIQKGYINAVYKMFPIMAYYNPRSIPGQYEVYNILNRSYEKEKKQLTWILNE